MVLWFDQFFGFDFQVDGLVKESIGSILVFQVDGLVVSIMVWTKRSRAQFF